jgi:hypothetical protein
MTSKSLKSITPVFAAAPTAARLLDITKAEFLRLVETKCLPAPVLIGKNHRWDMAALYDILNGSAQNGLGNVRW